MNSSWLSRSNFRSFGPRSLPWRQSSISIEPLLFLSVLLSSTTGSYSDIFEALVRVPSFPTAQSLICLCSLTYCISTISILIISCALVIQAYVKTSNILHVFFEIGLTSMFIPPLNDWISHERVNSRLPPSHFATYRRSFTVLIALASIIILKVSLAFVRLSDSCVMCYWELFQNVFVVMMPYSVTPSYFSPLGICFKYHPTYGNSVCGIFFIENAKTLNRIWYRCKLPPSFSTAWRGRFQ